MPTVKIKRVDVSLDEAMQAVRQKLGSDFKVDTTSHADQFSVNKGALSGAKVRMRRGDGETEFHVHGTGVIIGRLINEVTIARRVAAALDSAQLG